MKNVLMIASVASMLDSFNTRNINILKTLGYKVTLAANFKTESATSLEKIEIFKKSMEENGNEVVHIDFTRKVFNIKDQLKSYKQVKQLSQKRFDLVHCHTPICSAITRLIFREQRAKGTKIIYTAHGFHFYKGAPMTNWLLYYPVEKFLSRWTDILITINKEDYSLVKKKMKAKRVVYIPGVGVDISKFSLEKKDNNLRIKFGIPKESTWLLSVGEINKNKNHEMVIRAISHMENIYYTIAGKGELQEELLSLIYSLGVEKRVKLLGFCEDVASLYKAADVFVFPSYREGLPVALMEAMASGLPVIASKIRGNIDLIVENKGGMLCAAGQLEEFSEAIQRLSTDKELRKSMGSFNKKEVLKYACEDVDQKMKKIYEQI